ncbi:hypothetical protein AB6A40_001495 [Gnathostoma spinigerum]|uniref:Uncharacterized protein n=1 Tax=Gnathostoma spinigerum TaxID=75299 RepID=A0ABD6EBK0_9BILA
MYCAFRNMTYAFMQIPYWMPSVVSESVPENYSEHNISQSYLENYHNLPNCFSPGVNLKWTFFDASYGTYLYGISDVRGLSSTSYVFTEHAIYWTKLTEALSDIERKWVMVESVSGGILVLRSIMGDRKVLTIMDEFDPSLYEDLIEDNGIRSLAFYRGELRAEQVGEVIVERDVSEEPSTTPAIIYPNLTAEYEWNGTETCTLPVFQRDYFKAFIIKVCLCDLILTLLLAVLIIAHRSRIIPAYRRERIRVVLRNIKEQMNDKQRILKRAKFRLALIRFLARRRAAAIRALKKQTGDTSSTSEDVSDESKAKAVRSSVGTPTAGSNQIKLNASNSSH